MRIYPIISVLILNILLLGLGFGAKIDVTLSPTNAVGDGIANDTQAIQSAIESLNSGDTLYFPPDHVFKINRPLVLYKSGIVVQFASGAQIIADSKSEKSNYDRAKHNCMFYSVAQKDITFLNMVLNGNNIPSTGIYMWQCTDIKFQNCVIKNFRGDNERWSNGFDLRRCHDVTVQTCQFLNITNSHRSATGIKLDSDPNAQDSSGICKNIIIDDCQFINIKSRDDADGIKFVGRLKKSLYSNSRVQNCSFTNCYKRAVKIQTNGVSVLYNEIENSRTSNEKGDHLIDIQGVDSVRVIGNTITFNSRNPAAIGFILPNKNISIEDNRIIFSSDSSENKKSNYGIVSKCWMSGKINEPPFWGENIIIRNIDISTEDGAELDYGILLYTTGGGGKNWLIDSVRSPGSPFGILAGFEDVQIRHSTFSSIVDMTRQWDFNNLSGNKIHTRFYLSNRAICDQIPYTGYTGKITNVMQTDARYESGLYFAGRDNYIDFHSGNLWLMENKTLMLWLKLTEQAANLANTNPYYPGIFAHNATGSTKNYITFEKNPASGNYYLLFSDQKNQLRRSNGFAYQPDDWMHLAIVMSADSIPAFYINGQHKGSGEKSARLKLNYLGMGLKSSVNGGAFSGWMDELKILNKVLPADSISTYYHNQKIKYLKSEGKTD